MIDQSRRLTSVELLILAAIPLTAAIILAVIALSRPSQPLPPGRQDQRAYYETVVTQEKSAMDIAVKAAQIAEKSGTALELPKSTAAEEKEKDAPKPPESKGGSEPGN